MKKNIMCICIAVFFLLTACTRTPSQASPTLSAESSNPISSPLPTPTQMLAATETPTPAITPLPTIPTFTSTFDVSTIVTVTPAAKAECPPENPSVVAKFATPHSDGPRGYIAPEVLDYLNSGGTAAQLRDLGLGETRDLNGDGVNEVVYRGIARGAYIILDCKNGRYQDVLDFAGDSGVELADILDLNKNGVPEIILYDIVHYGSIDISIFEWDGSKFRSLIDMGRDTPTDPPIDRVSATSPHEIMDTNGDGLKEIVIMYDIHETESWGLGVGEFVTMQRPLRNITTILGWNGKNFVDLKQGSYPPPQYRFQAVQDGDEQVRYGNYAAALSFYQAAIFDSRLEWWSPKRREYELSVLRTQFEPTPTVLPTPIPDTTEYPRLAAYAYYRIMLLHIVQGHESNAGTVYKTLLQKFSNDLYGQPYVEMATLFWEGYRSTQQMYPGCAAAIQYAAEHPEILAPLGSDYHGDQSHTYVPTDICPFR